MYNDLEKWLLAQGGPAIQLRMHAQQTDIIMFILDPKFQKIREGYGLLWVKDRRRYYACGWSPT